MEKKTPEIRKQTLDLRRKLTSDSDREKLDVAWNRYSDALTIAAGPDPNRAEHWQKVAGDRLAALKRIMQSLQNGVDLAANAVSKKKAG